MGQGIRDFLGQGGAAQCQLLFDMREADLFTLQSLQAFSDEMRAMRLLIDEKLNSTVVCGPTAFLNNPVVREFRRRYYTPRRPTWLVDDVAATEGAVIEYFTTHHPSSSVK